jgi:hypothetical protein
MSTIAAAALTADRIDYWVRRHTIQYCHGTHPSRSKLNPARDRRVGLLAIAQYLKDTESLRKESSQGAPPADGPCWR